MIARRLALTLRSGMEIRLFRVSVSRDGRRIRARNHRYEVVAEWCSRNPFATLRLVSTSGTFAEPEIPLGSFEPSGMRFMEYLAEN